MQAGIEDIGGIFYEQLRRIVPDGLLEMFVQEVTELCGETYPPSESVHRRAGSEIVTIQATAGKEFISKRRVREMLPNGLEREVRLKSYSEVKRRKLKFTNCPTSAIWNQDLWIADREAVGPSLKIAGDGSTRLQADLKNLNQGRFV